MPRGSRVVTRCDYVQRGVTVGLTPLVGPPAATLRQYIQIVFQEARNHDVNMVRNSQRTHTLQGLESARMGGSCTLRATSVCDVVKRDEQ